MIGTSFYELRNNELMILPQILRFFNTYGYSGMECFVKNTDNNH